MTDVNEAAPAASQNTSRHYGSFVWYELLTTDAEAATRFYQSVVGWTVDNPDNGYRHIRAGPESVGGMLELTPEMQSGGARPAWLGYIAVDDVDRAVAQVESAGGRTLMPARDMENVGRFALLADPQGAPFYVIRPQPPAGREDAESHAFSVDQPQHVRWNELSTSDQDGAIAFYTRLFGWTQEGGMPMGEMGDYKFINRGGVMIGAVMRKPPQMPVSAWTYYIGVDDIDRAAAAVTDGGGRIIMGPMEIPGGEFSLNALDPQGAHFGLVGPRK